MSKYNQKIACLNLNMRYNRIPLLLVLVLLSGSQLALFYTKLREQVSMTSIGTSMTENLSASSVPRFEALLSISYFQQFYYAAFAILFVLIATIPIRQSMGGKGRLTLLRLPIKRSTQFVLQVIYSVITLLFLFVAELLTIYIAYVIYQKTVGSELLLNNAFFLAFIRSPFLRVLFPVTNPLYFLYQVFFFLGISFSAAYLGLCLQTKHSFTPVIASIILYFIAIDVDNSSVWTCILLPIVMAFLLYSMSSNLKLFLYNETNA